MAIQIRTTLDEPQTDAAFVPHRPNRPAKVEGGRRFKLVSDYQPAGDQPAAIKELTEAALAGQTFMVDLPTQTVTVGAEAIPFTIDPDAKAALLNGWDETDQILSQYAADIAAFETRQRGLTPWLYRQEPPQ